MRQKQATKQGRDADEELERRVGKAKRVVEVVAADQKQATPMAVRAPTRSDAAQSWRRIRNRLVLVSMAFDFGSGARLP